jgi:ABC-2 type transport system permease protein
MSAATVPPEATIQGGAAPRPELRVPSSGWRVVAAKEFGDHLLSVRFIVLLVVLGLAAAIPLYFAADRIRAAATDASTIPAIFLYLFRLGSEQIDILRVDAFVGMVAPLLGIAFAFDAVNGERSEGTLPRLVAQPIYRDDVINGKFVAGMAVIGLVLVAVVGLIAGFGIVRLGIVPHGSEVARLAAWVVATFLYVALWLAFGLLLSVVVRRAATAALIGFGVWLLVSVFGSLITTIVTGFLRPSSDADIDTILGNAQLTQFIGRLMPSKLYQEISLVILNPSQTQVSAPTTIEQVQQGQQRIDPLLTTLTLDQSLLLVWPQIVALVGLTIVCFGLAYVAFMRQEVRA